MINIPSLSREAIEEPLLINNDRLITDYSFKGKRVCVSSVGTEKKKKYKAILADLGATTVETIRGNLSPTKYANAIIIRQPDFDLRATSKRDDAMLRQKEDPNFCVFTESCFCKYLALLNEQEIQKGNIPSGKAYPKKLK